MKITGFGHIVFNLICNYRTTTIFSGKMLNNNRKIRIVVKGKGILT